MPWFYLVSAAHAEVSAVAAALGAADEAACASVVATPGGSTPGLAVDADNRKAIASAGGIDAVVSALRSHGGSHAGVAEQGCGALRNLAVDDDNEKAIASAGGIAAVVSALRAHGKRRRA